MHNPHLQLFGNFQPENRQQQHSISKAKIRQDMAQLMAVEN